MLEVMVLTLASRTIFFRCGKDTDFMSQLTWFMSVNGKISYKRTMFLLKVFMNSSMIWFKLSYDFSNVALTLLCDLLFWLVKFQYVLLGHTLLCFELVVLPHWRLCNFLILDTFEVLMHILFHNIWSDVLPLVEDRLDCWTTSDFGESWCFRDLAAICLYCYYSYSFHTLYMV